MFMRAIRSNSFRPAPWGRKRYFAPLPVLSVLLLATVIANPNILRTDFLIYQDSGLSIVARLSQVVHLSSPTGTVVGTMTITNTHTFGISVSALGATLVSITGSPISLTIGTPPGRPPINVPAGATVTVPFNGPFSGDLTTLTAGQEFSVQPNVSWVEVYESGTAGPFTYTFAKTCTIPSTIVAFPSGGQWVAICS